MKRSIHSALRVIGIVSLVLVSPLVFIGHARAQAGNLLKPALGSHGELLAELPIYHLNVFSLALGQSRAIVSLTGLGASWRSIQRSDLALMVFGRLGIDQQELLIMHGGLGVDYFWYGGHSYVRRDGQHRWHFRPRLSLSTALRIGYADINLAAYGLRSSQILQSGKLADIEASLFLGETAFTLHYQLLPSLALTWGVEGGYPLASSSSDLEIMVMGTTLGARFLLW